MSTQPTSCGETFLPAIPIGEGVRPIDSQTRIAAESATTIALPHTRSKADSSTGIAEGERTSRPLVSIFLESENAFYDEYPWCLNAFPTLQDVTGYLALELKKLDQLDGWQYSEVLTNIFLLSCAITDTVDDYLLGTTFDFSKLTKASRLFGPGVRAAHTLLDWKSRIRLASLYRLRRWRETWADAVTDFLEHTMVASSVRAVSLDQRNRLMTLLSDRLSPNLATLRPKVPAFFRSRDFATADCLELARKFVSKFSTLDRPAIIVGLRTAGSFLAPLMCAYLRHQRQNASWIAIRPGKGLASWERKELDSAARKDSLAIIADESVHTGQTLVKAIDLLRKAGFAEENIVVLNPVEPALPDWSNSRLFKSLSRIHVITLEPAERYKCRILDSKDSVQTNLERYLRARGYSEVRAVESSETEKLNSTWRDKPSERVDQRLKRVYEVHLRNVSGSTEVRHVLAKSVGWGWLGYHAFVTGKRLAGLVPPILGLRDGIMYSEWLPQIEGGETRASHRDAMIRSLASYVATRARNLGLRDNPAPDLTDDRRHKGFELLGNQLSQAYSSRIVAAAKRFQLRRDLARANKFLPVMTDSKMSCEEWIVSDGRMIKTDFEHHCFGKNEFAITDPAFDLAGAIFHFELSENESQRLVSRYIAESGDTHVEERLFLNKLLTSLRAISIAEHDLHHPRLLPQRDAANRLYLSAWNFLVGESVQECGKLCVRPKEVRWHAPLVVADIDGVLDRMVFGFPCTTASGIKALSLLHAHGFCMAVNTARTLQEVRKYCRAYSFAGGVAEYGAVLWDATSNRERLLVDGESLEQLRKVREAFRAIPGCFLNDDYLYSLRVFTYQNGRTHPVPSLLAQDLLANLNADHLTIHHTGLDTAILVKGVDKGTGLLSLLEFVGLPRVDVATIGDSEPDLAMFRVSNSSFAPGNVTCRKEAQLLGCNIAARGYQPGLLEIAKRIAHPNGGTCKLCQHIEASWPKEQNLFASLLEAADQKPLPMLLRNFRPLSFAAAFKK